MADRAEALRARLLAAFRVEAEEHLRVLAAELEAIAADPGAADVAERLETVFRAMHTLKGAARSVALADFEAAAHRCEALISALIRQGAAPDPQAVHRLQDASDALARSVSGATDAEDLAQIGLGGPELLEHGPPPTPAPDAPTAATDAPREVIRVETMRLDRLFMLAENLLSPKLAAAEHADDAAQLVEELRAVRTSASPLEELRALELRARRLATALRADQRTLRTTVDDLYDELLRVRMTPASTMLEGFPLMVRDLCRMTGKDVAWQSSGEHLEIDRKVLALVKDPLIHMVRNAIDHGIEAPDVREAAGKPRRGRVSVSIAPADGGRVSIEVADDGRGFAIEALRDAAVRSRLATPERVAEMSDADVAELAFNAGISTTPVVTTISGHGRGLAIVREAIERIEGRISTRSTAGLGTVIRLELPSSIVTYRALLVSAEGTRFLIPVDAVERAFPLARDAVGAALASGQLAVGDESMPFGSLRRVLALAPSRAADDERRELPCLLVRSGERHGVVLVDEVIGEHEVVIKALQPPLLRVRNVLAAALLGTGDLVLVLRPLDLLRSLQAKPNNGAEPRTPTARAPRVLVVDDSITTRMMERSLFEAAGYTVRVATDGLHGWEMLQSEEIDVVVSDVDMPQMDGFELTSRIRAHPKFAELPVVLVTAREHSEDEERGLRSGANAYVLKSAFDQTTLLEIVRRLM